MQRAALDQRRADGPASALELGLDDHAFGGALGIGGELEHLGLQRDRFKQLVETDLLQRRDLDLERVAAERFDHDLVAQKLGAHALRVGALLVDLVDGDDHRDAGSLGVIDGLDRLRLYTVVGGHHQHDDVGDLGTALAHGGERLVARRVDEGDLVPERRHDLIGADMLGDAAGLLGHDIGRADCVEQRGLAVIDVAHDGYNRRARLEVFGVVLFTDEPFLDVGLGHAPDGVSEFLGNQLGGIGVDHIGDLAHLAVAHQELDDVDAALGHAVGELLDGDDLGNDDLALDLGLRLGSGDLLLLALLAALQRGKAPLTLLLVKRVGDREPAANAALLAAARRHGTLLMASVWGAGRLLRLFLQEVLADGFLADLARLGLRLMALVLLDLALGRDLLL